MDRTGCQALDAGTTQGCLGAGKIQPIYTLQTLLTWLLRFAPDTERYWQQKASSYPILALDIAVSTLSAGREVFVADYVHEQKVDGSLEPTDDALDVSDGEDEVETDDEMKDVMETLDIQESDESDDMSPQEAMSQLVAERTEVSSG